MKQDELDRLILQLLQKNGKLTNEEIGRMLQRSPSTIRDRIKGMEEDRTILGYSAIVDERRVGILADAYISAEIDPKKESIRAHRAARASERLGDTPCDR